MRRGLACEARGGHASPRVRFAFNATVNENSGMASNTLRNPQLEGAPFFWQAGPTGVLLLHGYTSTPAEVYPLAQFLYARGYTVAGPLLPGHGTTPQDLNTCQWQDWAEAVARAYEELAGHCSQVLIGGESLGALLTLYTASEPVAQDAAGIMTFAPALLVPGGRLVIARLLAPFVAYLPKPRNPTDAFVDSRWQGYDVNPLRAAVQVGKLQRIVRQRLQAIRQPILILQGRLDTSIDPRSAEVVYQEVGSAVKELHWMERSTHCVILDVEWEQAAELTVRFIERVLGK